MDYTSVDHKPRFFNSTCESMGNVTEGIKEDCAHRALMEKIYEHLHYPEDVYKNQIEGFVEVQFTVSKKGKVENIEIIQDIGYGCGEEVDRVFRMISESGKPWIPGLQNDTPVYVIYTLPVPFLLHKVTKMLRSNEDKKIYSAQEVDIKPRFYHRYCENIDDLKEKEICAHNEFMNFINQNLEYPEQALKDNIEGRVDARFVVDKNGEIGGIGIVNDFGYGSKEETIRLINLMKEESLIWKPGVLYGNLVNTAYNVTIRFLR
ncbi:MAG: TonB family protein [Saprospiraceae bacterium]|nr:TonB family protein [Saprospiraceae bacterium]